MTRKFLLFLSAINVLVWAIPEQARAADKPRQTATPTFSANPALIDRAHAWLEHERNEPTAETLSDEIREFTQPLNGVELHAGYVAEVLGNFSGGQNRGAAYNGLFKLALKLDLERLFPRSGWSGATIFANALYPHGSGLTQNFTQDFNGVSNIDGYDSFRLNELWFEQAVGEKFSIRFGLLAADTEFFVCESGTLFVNSCFGALPTFSLNFDSPVYPVTSPAVRLSLSPTDQWTFRAAIFSGDVGAQDSNNKHGARFSFHSQAGALVLGEAVYHTLWKLPGAFTLGGFYHSGRFQDVSGDGTLQRGNTGFYAVVDQAVFRESTSPSGKNTPPSAEQGLNAFSRAGIASPDNRNPVTFYVEGGLTYKGLLPGRDIDTCGIACSFTKLSDASRDEQGFALRSHHEVAAEASYQAVVNGWLSIQPSVQYIVNPGAAAKVPDAFVAGLRLSLNF